jgi:hypothetical protein
MGVTRPEDALFTAIYYGLNLSPADLPATAVREHYSPNSPVTEEECRAALAACLAKGWLQVIDESALARITGELRAGRFLGPIYHLPPVGGVDFTPAGAELWHCLRDRIRSHREPPFAYTDVVHIKTARYFRTSVAADAAIARAWEEDDVVAVTGPTAIGPWRVQWWRRFPEGYRIDVEERTQWQGRASGGGEDCYLDRSPQKSDWRRLRYVLDRHNVTLAEWLFLASMDLITWHKSAASLLRWAAESRDAHFGVTVSEKERRIALYACLRYGWLRSVDRNAVDEVRALLRNDPALLPVPSKVESNEGEIDFSPDGAALYRTVAAEWLGPTWEDGLRVGKAHYWEVHRYCETEEGLQGIVQKHEDRGEIVRASRVVPIGPWCVYWWERYPAGYRMELQIGDP